MTKGNNNDIIIIMKGEKSMNYKEFNKEQRAKDKERHKCITYVDPTKVEEIMQQYSHKIEQQKRFRKYGN